MTLFHNAQVFTAEPDHPYAEAVAVRGERILAVGALARGRTVAGAAARRVDLKGRFLMPGMLDAHAHPIDGGLTLIQANFPDASDSVPALTEFVAQQMKSGESRRGDVLVVYGIDLGYWTACRRHRCGIEPRRLRQAADRAVRLGRPYGLGQPPARARAGITAQYLRTLKPEEQRYYGFDGAYNPNGFAVDAGVNRIAQHRPAAARQRRCWQAGQAAVHYMNSLGITGWLDAAVSGEIGGTRAGARRRSGLPARVPRAGAARRTDGARGCLPGRAAGPRQPADRGGRSPARAVQGHPQPHASRA